MRQASNGHGAFRPVLLPFGVDAMKPKAQPATDGARREAWSATGDGQHTARSLECNRRRTPHSSEPGASPVSWPLIVSRRASAAALVLTASPRIVLGRASAVALVLTVSPWLGVGCRSVKPQQQRITPKGWGRLGKFFEICAGFWRFFVPVFAEKPCKHGVFALEKKILQRLAPPTAPFRVVADGPPLTARRGCAKVQPSAGQAAQPAGPSSPAQTPRL